MQRLASSVGFGTTARLASGKNLPDFDVSSEPGGCYATPAQLNGSTVQVQVSGLNFRYLQAFEALQVFNEVQFGLCTHRTKGVIESG
jgi:hypothetical protein